MQLQKPREQYQKIPKCVVAQQEAGKFLGMRRSFARNLPNLPEKKLRPPRKTLHFLLGAAAILVRIFRGLLRFSGIV